MSAFFSDLTGDSSIEANYVNSDNITIGAELDMSAAEVIGSLIPTIDNTFNLGSGAKRWANIYSNSSFNGPQINVDIIDNYTLDTNLTLRATNGVAIVQVNDDLDVTGHLEVQGSSEFFLGSLFDQTVDILGTLSVDQITSKTANANLQLSGNGTGVVEVTDALKTPTIELTNATNQIVVQPNDAGTFYVIRGNGNPTVSRTLSFPDLANGTFLIDNASQTINGDLTLNNLNVNSAISTNGSVNLTLTTFNPANEILVNRSISQLTGSALGITCDNVFTDVITSRTLNNDLKFVANGLGQILVDDYVNINVGYTQKFLTQTVGKLGTIIAPSGLGAIANRQILLPELATTSTFVISEGTQSINGDKTFNDRVLTPQLIIQRNSVPVNGTIYFENNATKTTAVTSRSTAANRIYTLPDTGIDGDFVMTNSTGGQTITNQVTVVGPLGGTTLFANQTTNQIQLGLSAPTTSTVITCPAAAAVRTITIPDAGNNSNVILSEGTKTINGVCTFGSGILLPTSGGTPSSLDFYETGTFNTTFTCRTGSSGTVTYSIARIGKLVTMLVPSFTFTSGSSAITNTNVIISTAALLSRFRPTQARQEIANCTIEDNGNKSNGLLHVLSNGNIEFYKNPAVGVFAVSLTVGVTYGAAGSWVL